MTIMISQFLTGMNIQASLLLDRRPIENQFIYVVPKLIDSGCLRMFLVQIAFSENLQETRENPGQIWGFTRNFPPFLVSNLI